MKTIRQALDEMPDTLEEIVALFEREGIKAVGGGSLCRTCPVAIYLSKVTGLSVGVAPWCAWNTNDDVGVLYDYSIPSAVAEFISAYDAGNLPQFRP